MSETASMPLQNFIQALLEVSDIHLSEIQKVQKLIEENALQTLHVFYLDKKDEPLALLDIRFDGQNESDTQILESQPLGEILNIYREQIRNIHDQSDYKRVMIGVIFTEEAGQSVSFIESLTRSIEPLLFSEQKWQWALRTVEMKFEHSRYYFDKLKITMAILPRKSDS
jgi:hypothetical protein